jgi:hypothetical protein
LGVAAALFISNPPLGDASRLVVPSSRISAPVVKTVAGPPIAQPSLLVGVVAVIRWSSPVMNVFDVPSRIWPNVVLTPRPRKVQ